MNSEEKRKVFVVAKGFHDWTRAKDYGEVIFLSDTPVNRTAISSMARKFLPILKEQSRREDFLVISGLSVMCSIACSIFAGLHNRLNLLLYDAPSDRYILRAVVFGEEKEEEQENDG